MGKKNVLLITMDQWPWENFGFSGNRYIFTPTLDELSCCGIRYSSAYSCTPVCIPARRELMLGVSAKRHGDRNQTASMPMPKDIPTLAETFRNNGYQTYAVGKLHVYPQRDRIGFDDVILHEEGRHTPDMSQDDYERYLSLNGCHGQEYAHGMCNNNYMYRAFHLPEKFHPTTWTTSQMCEVIRRKDPTRPAFWYLSFAAPHPPLVPPQAYLDLYRDLSIPLPSIAEWAADPERTPYACRYYQQLRNVGSDAAVEGALKAVYATCTHIDHQIRTVIGTLSECGLLQDTVILITADHGDMLGTHNIWCKNLFYEGSCHIPFLLLPTPDTDFTPGSQDDRLVELKDVMPTLCQAAGIASPVSCEGLSVLGGLKRSFTYGELWDDQRTTRMVTDGRYKLIYYGFDNIFQFFDLQSDPGEQTNLIDCPQYSLPVRRLKEQLRNCLYGADEDMLRDGEFRGLPDGAIKKKGFSLNKRGLLSQRGIR